VSRGFIERGIAEQKEGEADYYGSAIWDIVMLEQWVDALKKRGATPVETGAETSKAHAAR
jgi:hypothetical protein